MKKLLAILLVAHSAALFAAADPILAVVDGQPILTSDVERLLAESPQAGQLDALDERTRAGLREDAFRRVVSARLLALEGRRRGIERRASLRNAVDRHRKERLQEAWLAAQRDASPLSDKIRKHLLKRFWDNPEGLRAMRNRTLAERARRQEAEALAALKQRVGARVYPQRMGSVKPDEVLAESDQGYRLTMEEFVRTEQPPEELGYLEEKLQRRVELDLIAREAERSGIVVDEQTARYREQEIVRLTLEALEQEWATDQTAMREYLLRNPQERSTGTYRHIYQIVVPTRAQAEALRDEFLDGIEPEKGLNAETRQRIAERFKRLAGQHSVDMKGRIRGGEVGWIRVGAATAPFEAALKGLPEGMASEVIEFPLGFYLALVDAQRTQTELSEQGLKALLEEQRDRLMEELHQRYKVEYRGVPSPRKQDLEG